MDNLETDFSTQGVFDLAAIVEDIQARKKSTVDSQLDFLLKAKTMGSAKASVVRGIANLQVYINLRGREKKARRTILIPIPFT